jgi:hypothetical protein
MGRLVLQHTLQQKGAAMPYESSSMLPLSLTASSWQAISPLGSITVSAPGGVATSAPLTPSVSMPWLGAGASTSSPSPVECVAVHQLWTTQLAPSICHAQACIVGTCGALASAAGLQAGRLQSGVLQGGVKVNCTWRSAAVELHRWGRSRCLRLEVSPHLRPSRRQCQCPR